MRSEALRIIRSHFGLYLHSCLVTIYKTPIRHGRWAYLTRLGNSGIPRAYLGRY